MDKLTFSLGWKSTLLTALVVPLCITLGLWQLDRANEKETIAAAYNQRSAMAPLSLAEVESFDDKTNLPVLLSGEFTGQHLLLENQWRRKKLGIEVLSVFKTEQQMVLVNRGWIEHRDLETIPEFTTPEGALTLFTVVYQPSKAPYTLGDLALNAASAVQRLNYLDIEQISNALAMDLYPLSLRLTAENLHGFDTYWPEINVKPETHIGYAVQWFLFAALAVIVFIFANSNLGALIRKRDK